MAKLEVDRELCKGCLICTVACPKGLLHRGEAYNKLGFYAVELENESGCSGCTLCAEVCPEVAILVWK